MKKKTILPAVAAMLLVSCSGKNKNAGDYPENFNAIGDAGRVDYMIRTVEPDSVARFIIYGALGLNPGAKIDTMAIATNHAYETYSQMNGDSLESFSVAYDSLVESLPLSEKMKVYMLAGSEDPQGLGYKLGLEYLSSIREKQMTLADVNKEIDAFEKACAQDTAMFRRFMIGFQTALEVDEGKDVPRDIYIKYTRR